jgi:hypothetical protein
VADCLKVGPPNFLGLVVGMGNIMAVLRSFTAQLTNTGHFLTSWPKVSGLHSESGILTQKYRGRKILLKCNCFVFTTKQRPKLKFGSSDSSKLIYDL